MSQNWQEMVSKPKYKVKAEKDVYITMRDGTRVAADIYRPDARGSFPALLSMSCYGKDIQKLPVPRLPINTRMGTGGIEAGDTEYFVSRGYAHVIADSRGTGLSDGAYRLLAKSEQEDGYDIIEWIAAQSWCDGNVGMLGMSYFAMIQPLVAALNPPHLRAIFVYRGCMDIYRQFTHHGGILNWAFFYQWWHHVLAHTFEPLDISDDELHQLVERAKNDPDVQSIPNVYIPLMIPEKNMNMFDFVTHPLDGSYYWERSAYTKFDQIKIPCYFLDGWTGWEMHLPGAFSAYTSIDAPKKLMITVAAGGARPWTGHHDLILRWYDHWLKNLDTGIMDEPPINILIPGTGQHRYENEWPLARTIWTKFYLREGNLLSKEPPIADEKESSFANNPGLRTGQPVPHVSYTTTPLTSDLELTGPLALYLHASLSTSDANWFVEIHDVDGENSQKLVSKGWLKASHREVDSSKSKPYQPFHPHTKAAPIRPGAINEYVIGIVETSNVFKAGHKIRLVIKGQDDGSGNLNWHLNNSRETEHTIYHKPEHSSYLILPVIP